MRAEDRQEKFRDTRLAAQKAAHLDELFSQMGKGEVAYLNIVLKADVRAGADVEAGIKEFVKVRLAAHEYPREIEFVSELPMTATGKIMRKDLKELEIKRKSKA